jgi:flavin reductase (DIM6/NTAB) family NADH-FMN oxidoreductase RutF
MNSFAEREFRDALGQFATGVVIVTADVSGQRLASTVSSFNSVSLRPPLVLFSIARSSHSLEGWQAAEHYGVTVLAEHQIDLSNRFAKPQTDKWKGFETDQMQNGAPLLPNWLAYFECTSYARYDGGDHEILMGRVTRFVVHSSHSAPLLFYQGKYRRLAAEIPIIPPHDADVWPHGW